MRFRAAALSILMLALSRAAAFAQGPAEIPAAPDIAPIALPTPARTGGQPLMEALNKRRSSRDFANTPLPLQQVSNLLWAAAGINGADGRRTVPSALNQQEVSVYMIDQKGAFLYDAVKNTLVPVAAGDFRGKAGMQSFVAQASLNLVYVFDSRKSGDSERDLVAAAVSAGAMVQNVYLYCASEKLHCVSRTMFDAAQLAPLLKLAPSQRVIITQSVGAAPG